MNRFVKNIVAFLGLTAIVYCILILFWDAFAPGLLKPNIQYHQRVNRHMTDERIEDIQNFKDIDILFLGSSHAVRSFDTRIFKENGFTSFNLGSSAQTPLQTQLLLNRYLDRLNPKLVVFEVFPAIFYLDGVESSLDIIANDTNDWNSVKMALQLNNIKTYNTLIYAFAYNIINENHTRSDLKHEKDTYISGGFIERKLEYFEPSSMEFDDINIIFEDYQHKAFNEILINLKSRDIEVILAYAPIPKAMYNSYTNKEEYNSMMSKMATYYNFNEMLDINDSLHFYDYNHLNQLGVIKLNHEFIKILKHNHKNLKVN